MPRSAPSGVVAGWAAAPGVASSAAAAADERHGCERDPEQAPHSPSPPQNFWLSAIAWPSAGRTDCRRRTAGVLRDPARRELGVLARALDRARRARPASSRKTVDLPLRVHALLERAVDVQRLQNTDAAAVPVGQVVHPRLLDERFPQRDPRLPADMVLREHLAGERAMLGSAAPERDAAAATEEVCTVARDVGRVPVDQADLQPGVLAAGRVALTPLGPLGPAP